MEKATKIPSPLNRALVLSIPALAVYIPLGLAFGLVFTNQGYDWFYAPLMSAFIYAGAVQFVALSMLTENAGLFAILITTLFIASRNSFYGLSLLERFSSPWYKKIFLVFGLVDATYAILLAYKHPTEDLKFCLLVTFFVYVYWVFGTFLGAIFADLLPKINGLDFILTSFFTALVINYFMIHRQLRPIIVPIVTSIIAYKIFPQYYLLIAITMCVIYLYLTTNTPVTNA